MNVKIVKLISGEELIGEYDLLAYQITLDFSKGRVKPSERKNKMRQNDD